MWDPAALEPGGDGLSGYTDFVKTLASLALSLNRSVLLINGDSHVYGTDRPLADPSSATGQIHGTPAVPNLTRTTVQGSTNKPREWLRLTVDPQSPGVFSWQNVIYCNDTTWSPEASRRWRLLQFCDQPALARTALTIQGSPWIGGRWALILEIV
jgi:hypothetical protein